ncbi:hypothetical protein BJ982_002674 [Sphaerisporangium siamense]|uniref:Uncharacterized protein n=1 Tax=Sphaerisporangium siamense TaxID=795645 RepID=A0A7W7D6G7_9ACTN|nr:hypothetical protein [Sphaerisporangium siamense]
MLTADVRPGCGQCSCYLDDRVISRPPDER